MADFFVREAVEFVDDRIDLAVSGFRFVVTRFIGLFVRSDPIHRVSLGFAIVYLTRFQPHKCGYYKRPLLCLHECKHYE